MKAIVGAPRCRLGMSVGQHYWKERIDSPKTELEVINLRLCQTALHRLRKDKFAIVRLQACKSHSPDEFDLRLTVRDLRG